MEKKNELNLNTFVFQITPEVIIDIKELVRATGDSAYFRVDDICDFYGKRVEQFFDRNRSESRHLYRKELLDYAKSYSPKMGNNSELPEYSGLEDIKSSNTLMCANSKLPENSGSEGVKELKHKNSLELSDDSYASTFSKKKRNHYVDGIGYNRYDLGYLAYRLDGRAKDMKKEVKGTYLHTDLAFELFRWLSPALSVHMDKLYKTLLTNIDLLHQERKETINEFHKLIKVSDKYYVDKQESGFPQEYANQRLMDMINIEVLGCKASTYKKRNNIAINAKTRDWLTPKQLADIHKAEDIVCGLIRFAKIYDYNTLKYMLHDEMVNS